MSNQLLIDLVEELTQQKDELSDKVEDARSECEEARGDIDQAKDHLCDAYNEADRAEDRCIEAQDMLSELGAKLEELSSKLQGEELTGLDADIARNKDKVLHLTNQGNPVAAIAKHLSISTVLVEAILRRHQRAA